ncbi:hypothetical protein DMN77_08260 [Paenibacillus sp. 79R4]|uniref:S24 family peptidase n=1 Tax=Paenibacillus sp. 79R4 TaxID=2212847 RepID=UPI0015BEEA53|nr:hypothetical protein [Paenibacillus sp. 79R4]
MTYSDLVNEYIEKSGLSLGEIAKRMTDRGIKIDRSYISMLKNNKTKNPASEEVNRAFAEVTGGDPEKLVFTSFIDRAPETIKAVLENINDIDTYISTLLKKVGMDNTLFQEQIKEMGSNEISNITIDDLIDVMSFEEKLEVLKVFIEDSFSQNKTLEKYISDLDQKRFHEKSNVLPFNSESLLQIPLVGRIAAGVPIERIENIEGYTLVDPAILRGKEGFALTVQGDSMIGDRIHDGDMVIIAKQKEVNPHDIAVVVIDHETVTLKRVRKEGSMCLLIPSNPTMQPSLIPAEQVEIIGKVVEVKFWPK